MANEKNLKPIRSENEAREKGKKGGKKSGEVRAKKKSLKEELLILLETKIENKTIQEKISFSLIQEALKGNVKAFETIRDTIRRKAYRTDTKLKSTSNKYRKTKKRWLIRII